MPARKHSLQSLNKKALRNAFFKGHIHNGLAHQVRLLRKQRGWTQQQLAKKIGVRSQSAVARVEDPSYDGISMSTIIKLANAFDVAAMVRFVSYGKLLDETADLSPSAITPVAFDEELRLESQSSEPISVSKLQFRANSSAQSSNISVEPDVVTLLNTYRSSTVVANW